VAQTNPTICKSSVGPAIARRLTNPTFQGLRRQNALKPSIWGQGHPHTGPFPEANPLPGKGKWMGAQSGADKENYVMSKLELNQTKKIALILLGSVSIKAITQIDCVCILPNGKILGNF